MAGHTINDDMLDAARRSSALAAAASDPTNGPDSLTGSDDRDTISLLRGNDTYSGLGGSDLIYGNVGRDLIYGNAGRDTVFGGQNADTVYGGGDADKLYGNLGDDRLFGERGNDLVYGNEGRDQLFGGDGRDTLYGGQDDDLLEGGAGDDSIIGGRGNDTAVFSGTRASYTITKNRDGSFTLDGASGRDHVETVENFRFDDGTFDANTLLTGNPSGGGGGGTPVPPEDQAPIARFDAKTIDSSEIDQNGTNLLNVLDNDDDPQLQTLSVYDVSNFQVTANSVSVTVTENPQDADGNQLFEFNYNGANYDVTVERDGDLNLLVSGNISNPLQFRFEYNAIDPDNNVSNTSSVNISITDDPNPQAAGVI